MAGSTVTTGTFASVSLLCRCPQQQHVASQASHNNVRSVVSLAAAAETAEAVAPAADLTAAESAPAPSTHKKQRKPKSQKQQPADAGKEEAPSDAIIVLDKPVTNSIVRRLAEVRGSSRVACMLLLLCRSGLACSTQRRRADLDAQASLGELPCLRR